MKNLMNKKLTEYKRNKRYGTVVESPNETIHILRDESISVGEVGITLCGQKFVDDGESHNSWELFKDFHFDTPESVKPYQNYITCKNCRKLEIKRMKLEILKEVKESNEKNNLLEEQKLSKLNSKLIKIIAAIAEGKIIPAKRVIVYYKCCRCGSIDNESLERGATSVGICDECNKIENFMEIVGITITKN